MKLLPEKRLGTRWLSCIVGADRGRSRGAAQPAVASDEHAGWLEAAPGAAKRETVEGLEGSTGGACSYS